VDRPIPRSIASGGISYFCCDGPFSAGIYVFADPPGELSCLLQPQFVQRNVHCEGRRSVFGE
jgi:hypothetical protein